MHMADQHEKVFKKGEFGLPKVMLRPDQPLVIPKEHVLVLKISDALSLACVPVPAGRHSCRALCSL